MKFLILSFLLIGAVFCEISELECIEKYFADKAEFSKDKICQEIVQSYTNKFSEKYLNLGPETDKTCALKVQEVYKFNDLYLKGLAHHLRNKTDEGKFEERYNKTASFLQDQQSLFCETDDGLLKLFEEMYHIRRDWSGDHTQQCKAKYMIDIQLINPEEFKVEEYYFNVTGCEDLIKLLTRNEKPFFTIFGYDLFGLSLDKPDDCMKQNFLQPSLKLSSFENIGGFEIPSEKLGEVKTNFIKAYRDLMRIPLECLGKVL